MRKLQLLLCATIFTSLCYGQNNDPYAIFGHQSKVEYKSSSINELLYIKNQDANSEIKALAFNVEQREMLLLGVNDEVLQKINVEPQQFLRWLSVDPLDAKYPSQSPYNFVANMPISAIDPDGKEIYILFYTHGNNRGDEMFRASALTRKVDIERQKGFDPSKDKVVVIGMQDIASIQSQVDNVVNVHSPKYGQTIEFSIWSHAGKDGPTGTVQTSSNPLDKKQMTLSGWESINFNWSDNASANFYGCKTGVPKSVATSDWIDNGMGGIIKDFKTTTFAKQISELSNFKDVTVSGQTSSAYPSMYTNYRLNSENGADNFINNEENGVINFQRTYLVGGNPSYRGLNTNTSQTVAHPMQNNVNGETTGTSYQSGTTR